MLRLSRCRPLVALSRGFAANATDEAAAVARQEAAYYADIARKYSQWCGRDVSMEAVDRARNFLETRGFSRTKALHTIARHTGMVLYSRELMESKIEYLRGFGMNDDKINDTIWRGPAILGTSVEKLKQLEDWYIDHGVPREKIPFMFFMSPSAATKSIEYNFEPKLEFLKSLGCSDEQIGRILLKFPNILNLGVQRMQTNVDFLLQMGIPEQELPDYLAKYTTAFALNADRIQATMDALEEMFGPGTALGVVKSYFRILMSNVHSMRRSFEYLVSLGFTAERLRGKTWFLIRNETSILRPRAEFLRAKGVDVVASVTWIMMPELTFKAKYLDYEEFLRRFKERQQKEGTPSA